MQYHFDAALPPSFTVDAFRAAIESTGARFIHHIPRGPRQLEESIWELEEGRSCIRHVYDHFVDVAFARAESETVGRPTGLLHELGSVLPFEYSDALIRQTASQEPATRAHALCALAVTTPSFRIDVFDVIQRALLDGDPRIRATAMKAIARWPYARFAGELDRLAQTETVPELQREAVRLAADLRQHGRRGLH